MTMADAGIPPLSCAELPRGALAALLARHGAQLVEVPAGEEIPGSYWGDSEAGIIGTRVYVRPDTPVHSALHEACHLFCLDAERRATLHTDAGGDFDEENAVCYLQILLGGELAGFGRERAFADMDAWGYTFRLGSARAWFEGDAEDARAWLVREGLLSEADELTWRMRTWPSPPPSPPAGGRGPG